MICVVQNFKCFSFRWNDKGQMLAVEKQVFEDWVKNKPFPYYGDVAIVFGKDWANGKRAMLWMRLRR
nr:hypothetical protein CFP56_23562 [Quercus suber]